MVPRALLAVGAALLIAAGPDPRAAARFPQPVRVGDLIGRAVLAPVEAQPVLGIVRGVVRGPDGGFGLVLSHGGWLGFGRRLAVVPLETAALLGEYVALVGLTPEQLEALPVAVDPGAPVPPDAVVEMGLVRPFH